uniref:Ubiquitin-like domain-containing protein n=1 Tax=Acrobeloides nanus TaxID=290746 RepID=A0A914E113_9BILA
MMLELLIVKNIDIPYSQSFYAMPDDTILDTKEKIIKMLSKTEQVHQITLSYKGNILEDSQMLVTNYGIKDGAQIVAEVKVSLKSVKNSPTLVEIIKNGLPEEIINQSVNSPSTCSEVSETAKLKEATKVLRNLVYPTTVQNGDKIDAEILTSLRQNEAKSSGSINEIIQEYTSVLYENQELLQKSQSQQEFIDWMREKYDSLLGDRHQLLNLLKKSEKVLSQQEEEKRIIEKENALLVKEIENLKVSYGHQGIYKNRLDEDKNVKNLKRELDNLRFSMANFICLGCKIKPRQTIFLPCCHMVYCQECVSKTEKCRICNVDAIGKVPFYTEVKGTID